MTDPDPDPTPVSHSGASKKPLDTKTIEVLALSAFRSLFGGEVRVPIKIEGMMDMDLLVRDNNVVLNLNKIEVHAPELLVWRLIFAYQGKPVVEYGRGIKNDMKVHLPQMCFLLLAIWRDKRRLVKAQAAADKARDRAMIARASGDATVAMVEDR
jgi:hypothetical protein